MKHSFVIPVKRLFFILLLSSAAILPQKLFATEQSSPWFKASNPEFSIRDKEVTDQEVPATYANRGNTNCDNLTFTKRDGDPLPFSPLHKERQISGCYVTTPIGPIDSHGYINISGTPYVAETINPDRSFIGIGAFPNSDAYVSSSSGTAAVGSYIWFDHLGTSYTYSKDNFGRIYAVIAPHAQVPLTDKSGNMLPVIGSNFGVSDNGEWAVVDSPGRGLLRINLTTLEALPFTNSFEYGNGVPALLRMAISSDGRYAAVASRNYQYFKIFDLNTCATVPDVITGPVACQSRDLNTFVRGKVAGMDGIFQMRFLTNNLIKFYATYNASGTTANGSFVVAAPDTYLTGMDYLAMGDSYSSGEGAQKYEIGTDETENLCHLSRLSYPYLIAKKIQVNNFHSVACSGGTTTNVMGGNIGIDKDAVKQGRDNQYGKRPSNNALGDWLPGYKKQIGFISINNPGIVTLGVGGNDIGFADKLTACLKPGTCFPTYEDRQEVFNEIDDKLPTFTATFTKTKSYATKNARIYVIGYPQVALTTGNCGLNVHLNQDELVFAASIITRLNTVIKTASEQAGVNYVDIEDALNGFRLCENNAGNIAMNGLTAGNDKIGIIGNESYHPNRFGHELMANKILGLTNYLGTATPPPNPTAKLEKIKDTDAALKNTPKTGRATAKKVTVPAATKTTTKSKKVKVTVKKTTRALVPKTPYTISVNGKPTGTTTTDANGEIDVDVDIPPTTETGPTTIDITGPDVTGELVDIGTVVTVGNDGPDFDGDGLPDINDSCALIANAFIDADQDGIDDACDPAIGPAPGTNVSVAMATTPASGSSPTGQNTVVTASTAQPDGPNSGSLPSDSAFTSSPQTYDTEGQVLGAETTNPSTGPIKTIAGASRNFLSSEASAHPLGFMLTMLSSIFGLILIVAKYRDSIKNSYVFRVITHHSLHV